MMNRGVQKVLSMLLTLCLVLGLSMGAVAETKADFEALVPLMDLVCAASQYSPNAPESISGSDSELTVSFVDAFFKVGKVYGAEVGVTAAMLGDTAAQADLLGKIFAAKAPALQPVTVNTIDGDSIQIIGEMYLADKAMREMKESDFVNLSWIDRAVFVFQKDAAAYNGFRITGFSVGTDLTYEAAMLAYDEEITVEYESKLGFMLLYPSLFTDDMLVEDESGVSAQLPDGSAAFFAKRMENENGATLADYVGIIANGITNSVSTVNEEMQYGTVSYTTDEGYVVFDVFIVTDQYIFQAELTYQTALIAEYGMFNAYLENSFVVNELSQG